MSIRNMLTVFLALEKDLAFITARENGNVNHMLLVLRAHGYNHTYAHGVAAVQFVKPSKDDILKHQIEKVRELLSHTTDGPVTMYVLIARACELVRKGEFEKVGIYDPVAEALDAEIIEGAFDAFKRSA